MKSVLNRARKNKYCEEERRGKERPENKYRTVIFSGVVS
jgi:hypothetical protein